MNSSRSVSKTRLGSFLIVLGLFALAVAPATADDLKGTNVSKLTMKSLEDGSAISPASSSGLTEIVFVASWCPPCERELRELRRRSGALRRNGYRVILVGVSRRQTSEQFARWAEGFGFRDALVFDDGELEKAFGAGLLPWHVVVDSGGVVLHEGDRAPTLEQLRTWGSKDSASAEGQPRIDG